MNILIIDDDEIFLDKLKKILSLDNHNIITSVSGEEALLKMDEAEFDLILTDLKMPGLSGIDFIKKTKEKGVKSKIIVITGYGTIQSAVEAIKAGSYDYLLKSLKISDLTTKIEAIERESKLRKEVSTLQNKGIIKLKEFLKLKESGRFKSPFLVISNESPNKIIKDFNLINTIPISINSYKNNSTKDLSIINLLRLSIEDFLKKNSQGTIVFKGIEDLIKIHNQNNLEKFIYFLQSEIANSDISLIILKTYDEFYLNDSYHAQLNVTLSPLVNPDLNKVINLLSHPIRKNIVYLLKSRKKMNYNKILKELNIKPSSLLSYHLNKLITENLIKKEKIYYSLNSKGSFFTEIMSQLENFGLKHFKSHIKVIEIPSSYQNV